MTTGTGAARADVDARRLARVKWSAGLSALVVGLNLSVMNVAVADLRSSFPSARLTTIGWVVSAYTIVFGAILVPAGRMADLLGRRSVFVTGIGVFAVGSIVAGTAPALWVLIAGRAVQGIGAACITPSSMALLLDAAPVAQRAAATSFFSGVSSIGGAAGPSLGALAIDASSWRAAFFLGLPVLLVAYALGRHALPASVPVRGAALPDLAGAVLIVVAMTSLTFGIVQGREWGWGDTRVHASFATAAVLVPLFVWRSARHPSPVMAIGLFRRRSFAGANAAALLFGMATGGVALANVLFLRDVWGYSLVEAGIGALPASLTALVFARFVGRAGMRVGEVVVGVPGALAIVVAMVWVRVVVDADGSYWLHWLPGSVLLGGGIVATYPMISLAVVRGLGRDELSLATATNRTFLQVGNAIGIAVVVAALGEATGAGALGAFRRTWVLLGALALGCTAAVAAMGSSLRARPSAPPG